MIFNNCNLFKLNKCHLKQFYFFVTYTSKVPKCPHLGVDLRSLPLETKIDKNTIEQLEKVSLVEFGNEKGIYIVEEAIRFADQIRLINTDGVEPLASVLEERSLPLREDIVSDGNCRDEVLQNAKFIEEDYFIAPPGNIPLETKDYDLKSLRSGKKS